MRKLFAATIAAMALTSAVPASAFSITFQPGTPGTASPAEYPILDNSTVIQNFDGTYNGTSQSSLTGIVYANSQGGVAARPAFGSAGNFAAVGNGQSYSLTFPAVQVVSFIVGSIDAFNRVTLFREAAAPIVLTGSQIKLGGDQDGNQIEGDTNGRVIYSASGIAGQRFTGITFDIVSGSGVAFEFDNIVTAIPEPAAWGMMLLGFVLVGGALRRRRTTVKFATA